MNNLKFNTNYNYNSIHNIGKIKNLVKELNDGDVNPQLFDFLFRFNTRNYPKTCHNVLDLPGIFDKLEDTAVIVIDDGVCQMDYAESIKPDGRMVKRDSLNDAEHQTGKLSDNKVKDIFDYCLYTTIQHKKPCYPIVVTNYDYGKEYDDYVVEGFSFRIYYRIFNKERIYEILNILSKKDYTKEELSDADYINLVFCIIFAKKPYAQDVVSYIAYFFASIEKITFNHQMDLHLALKMTIKYHFRGNDKKIEELLEMITKAIHQSRVDNVSGYEVEQFTIDELRDKYSKLKAEKVKELSLKDEEISLKDEEIKKLKKEVEELKNKD